MASGYVGQPRIPVTVNCRIVAVLEHDGIPARRRVSHLANACGFSKSTARRLLQGGAVDRSRLVVKLALGLDVGLAWLRWGSLEWPHPRTWRIEIERIKGYPEKDAARIVRMLSASIMGHPKAVNLVDLVASGQMSALQAARLL